jgi:hypothetical protein
MSRHQKTVKKEITMWSNIGGKIKLAAVINAWVGIIGCVVLGATIIVTGETETSGYVWESGEWVHGTTISATRVIIGFMVMFVGSFFAWVSSWVLYGYGVLIEKTEEIAKYTYQRTTGVAVTSVPKPLPMPHTQVPMPMPLPTQQNQAADTRIVCIGCGKLSSDHDIYCTYCSKLLR